MICLTILHKCSSSCLLSDFSRLPISWSVGSVSGDPASKKRSNVSSCSRWRPAGWCAIFAPWASVIMKRLLSSVTPSILMQESMTFPTVVSFGVRRWTICSDTRTQKSQIYFPISMIELIMHLHWPLTSLTINSNLYKMRNPWYHVVLALVSVVKKMFVI